MTPAPSGRTGDGYPGRGVPPRPEQRAQGPGPRTGREVPRPRPPQDRRQAPGEQFWDDYATPPRPQRPPRQQPPRDPRQGDPRDPRNPSYQPRPQDPRGNPSIDDTHVPRGTRRKPPQRLDDSGEILRQGPPRGRLRGDDTIYGELEEEHGWDEAEEETRVGRGRHGGRSRRQRRFDRLTPAQRRRRFIIRRSIAVLMALLLLVTGWSLTDALTKPGNMSTTARVAEWARGHWMGWAVTWLENQQYQANIPKTGGTLSPDQLKLLQPTATPTLAKDEHVLPPMKPFVANPAPGEGQWDPAVVINGVPVIQTAKLRSDPDHLQYLSAVAWMDAKHASFMMHAGSQQPPGPSSNYGSTDHLAGDQLKNLIATWNGAFLLKPNDAKGGFFLNGKTYGSLVNGQASEVFYKDGSMNIGAWGSGPTFTLDPNVVGVRQNLSLLVDNGQVNPSVDSENKNLWGVTVKNAYFVWRSGIGVTADGNIVYAVGPALSVRTLAELLQRAGAVRAMELDINEQWVSYMTYDGSKDPANPVSTKLVDFKRTERRYFSTEERDFVAVYSH